MKKYECYIQEYDNGKKARFRDKKTDKIVSFCDFPITEKQNLLRFMSGHKLMGLDITHKDSSDYVFIEGDLKSENEDEIILIYNKKLTYIYK